MLKSKTNKMMCFVSGDLLMENQFFIYRNKLLLLYLIMIINLNLIFCWLMRKINFNKKKLSFYDSKKNIRRYGTLNIIPFFLQEKKFSIVFVFLKETFIKKVVILLHHFLQNSIPQLVRNPKIERSRSASKNRYFSGK